MLIKLYHVPVGKLIIPIICDTLCYLSLYKINWFFSPSNGGSPKKRDIGFVDLFYDLWIQQSYHFYDFWIQIFFVHFYNFWIQKLLYFCGFWIQKLHHFYDFWIQNFFVHFFNCWIQKLQNFCSFWIQKLRHFYDFWEPYESWGADCLAPAGGPMDRRARLNLT